MLLNLGMENLTSLNPSLLVRLYLIRDFCYKLDCMDCPRNQFPAMLSTVCKAPSGLKNMPLFEFLKKVQGLFPSLRMHLDCAVNFPKEGKLLALLEEIRNIYA